MPDKDKPVGKIGGGLPTTTAEAAILAIGGGYHASRAPLCTNPGRSRVVYQANPIKGKKLIVIGHKFSEVACLPEKGEGPTTPWVVPLANQRVKSDEDKEMVGAE